MSIEMKLVEWDDREAVATIQVPLKITADEVNNVICGAIEGGIGHWGFFALSEEQMKRRKTVYEDHFLSDVVTLLILNGEEVKVKEMEDDDEVHIMTLEKLTKGISLWCARKEKVDFEQCDVLDYDCMIQLALFGKVVFG